MVHALPDAGADPRAVRQEQSDVSVVKVNVDESPQVAGSLGIRSIPTIGVFADGQLKARAVGVQNEVALSELVRKAS